MKDISKMSSPYKELLTDIYNMYKSEIKNFPDTLSYSNYGKKGSLILKLYNALRITKSIYKNKSLNDKDVIIASVLLKYIGRVKQYKYDVVFSHLKIGKNESCFILSRDIIKDYAKKNKSLEKSILMEIIDIILFDDDKVYDKNPKGSIVNTVFNLEKSISLNQLLEI